MRTFYHVSGRVRGKSSKSCELNPTPTPFIIYNSSSLEYPQCELYHQRCREA